MTMPGPHGAYQAPPPTKKGSPIGCIVAAIVAVLLLLAVGGVVAKSAVERYAERSREAARRLRDEEDDARSGGSASPSAAKSAAPAASASSGGEEVVVDLGAEGKLSLPHGARLAKELPPPENLTRSLAFDLGDGRALLVNVSKPESLGCSDELDREDRKGKDAAAQPAAKAVLRFAADERRKLAGRDVLYTEVESRTPDEARHDAPFHRGIGYLVCGKTSLVNLAFMRTRGDVDASDRALMEAVATSLLR